MNEAASHLPAHKCRWGEKTEDLVNLPGPSSCHAALPDHVGISSPMHL